MQPGALQLAARLCDALRREEEDMVEDLLRRGADPNLILPEGIAAIHLAAGMEQENETRCLSLILQYGGNPSVRSVDDLTPLHVAASWGCCTCLRLLLISGGDPRLEDQDGNTAIDLALEQGNEMCVCILQKYLEEEQSLWIPQRTAESFLTTLTEDLLESAGTSMLSEDDPPGQISRASKSSPNHTLQHVGPGTSSSPHSYALNCCIPGNSQQRSGIEDLLSSSLLTEDYHECSALYNHCNLHDELVSASSTFFSFDNMYGNLTSDQATMRGSPDDELILHTPKAQGGATQSHCIKSTTDSGYLCPDQNGTFPLASLTDFPSQKSRVSPEVPSASESPSTCTIQDECKATCLLGKQDAGATLDLSHSNCLLVPEPMVKVTGQEGLDVTSPDHTYFFCRVNSTAVSELEKTVVDLALLSKVYGDPGEHAVEGKLVSGSSNGESSRQYTSCNSESYKSTTDASCYIGTKKCKEKKGGDNSSMCESNHIGNNNLKSQMFLGPSSKASACCLGKDEDILLAAAVNKRVSSACSEGMRCLCDRLDFRGSSSKQCSRVSELHSTGKNEWPGNTGEPDLSQLSQDELLVNHFSDKRKNQGSCTPLSQESQQCWIPNDCRAGNTAVLEATSSVIGEQTSTNESQGKLKRSMSPEAWTELNKKEMRGNVQELDISLSPQDMEEKRANLVTQDTVPIQKMCAFAGAESSDTMAVAHHTLSAREEEFTEMEMKLRLMMISAKSFHSPLLQSNQKPCHVTPRTKSRMTASSTHNNGASSLFDESLEIPSRHRRVRSPQGITPASGKVKNWAVDLNNENLLCHVQDEIGGQDDTQLIVAVPNNFKQSSWPKSSSLGPIVTSPAPLNSGRDVCKGNDQSDVKRGSECSTSMEAKCLLEEVKCLPEDKEGVCTAQLIPDAVSSWAKPERPGSRRSRANHSRVSFSKLPAGELFGMPEISSRPSGRLNHISQDIPLSPGGRPVNLNAGEAVEYLYVDEDQGYTLVERHVPCTDDSVVSTTSSEDTVIYDWQAYANQVDRQSNENSPVQLPSEVQLLSDEVLVKKLRDFGVSPGPVTGLTRNVYVKLLEKLMNDPKTKTRKGSAGYSRELCSALETYQIPDGKGDEMVLAYQFDQPDKSRKWREGLLKSSFNYLLLDPRVTQNLPFRCQYISQAECFRTFVSAIFYVGKGKRSRPYCHLYEALTHYKKSWRIQRGQVCSKVQHILEIWASGQGVISMHCFQNVIPVEAYTREACMVDAIGLKMLTNQKKGNYYGIVAGWPLRRRQCLGVHLLHRAMQIFLAEGERQLRPTDICMGQ